MSHFSRIQTHIREEVTLKKSLEEMGYTFETGDLTIKDDAMQTAQVDIAVDVGAGDSKIGLKRMPNGDYEICADWFTIEKQSDVKRHKFIQSLMQTYARETVRKQARDKGYIIEDEKVLDNGEIKIVVSEPL